MEIKDLVGLSEPLKRLIEVISDGFGAISKPYLIKKTAEARAYEIKAITQAMAETPILLTHSDYEDGKIKITLQDKQPDDVSAITNRVATRLQYQELRQQQNVESICANAAEELAQETSVPDEKPEPEWISRFIEISSSISTDEIQNLWGRILAGEIKKPGSFSLRTLDILRNLSKKEAENFVKLGNYILRSEEKVFYIDPASYLFTKDDGLTFLDILGLKDAGLIYETDLEYSNLPQSAGKTSYVLYGPIILITERDKDTPKTSSSIGLLTKVGVELLQLISIQPDMDYISVIKNKFHADGVRFSHASILKKTDDQVIYGPQTYIEM